MFDLMLARSTRSLIGGRRLAPTPDRRHRPHLKLQALTPGPAISEGAVRSRLRMFVFDSKGQHPHTHGHRRPVRVYRARRDVTRPPFRSESCVYGAGAFRKLLG